MTDVKIEAANRVQFGKGAARQARRDGKVPAVVYAHGKDAKSILIDGHDAFLAIKNSRFALITLAIEGKNQKVIIKDIQRDPLGRVIEHIDFLAVKANEKQIVEVPVAFTGESAPGTMVQLELLNANVEAVVSSLPENVEVSAEGLEAGTVIYVKDVKLPKGQTFINDPEQVVLVVNEIHLEPLDDDAPAAAPAAASSSDEAAE